MRKKTKKRNEARRDFWTFLESVHSPKVADFLYLFLVFLTVSYATLIWLASLEKYNNIANFSPSPKKIASERRIRKFTQGFPMERMSRYIARQDDKTAALLVSVAKKESNWGKFSPQKDGKDCFNYWGYRGTGEVNRSGYSCFSSPREAVREVGGRMAELIGQEVDTPGEFIIWKCGWDSDCARSESARKWVQDVDYYYKKIY